MDGIGQQLLAGAGLAEEQDSGIGRGDLRDLLQDPGEGRGATRQSLSGARADGMAEVIVLRLQTLLEVRDLGKRGGELGLATAAHQGLGQHLADDL